MKGTETGSWCLSEPGGVGAGGRGSVVITPEPEGERVQPSSLCRVGFPLSKPVCLVDTRKGAVFTAR